MKPGMTVGEGLARVRKGKGLEQPQVAEALGYSTPSGVSNIETGNPKAETISKYLDACSATFFDLARELQSADEVREAVASYGGVARPEWVAMLVYRRLENGALAGLAMLLDQSDTNAAADFLASAREAAAELAQRALEDAERVRRSAKIDR